MEQVHYGSSVEALPLACRKLITVGISDQFSEDVVMILPIPLIGALIYVALILGLKSALKMLLFTGCGVKHQWKWT